MYSQIIDYINKKYGLSLSAAYYTEYVDMWRDWWKGYHKPFHREKVSNGDKIISRDLFTMKMAKKVCEDWAAILLNEKTEIVIEDERANAFLQGEEQTAGVLGENNFWVQANRMIERACSTGTGAIVLRAVGVKVGGSGAVQKTPDAKIRMSFLSAENIIPLSVENDAITEAAFCSEILYMGKKRLYLEIHTRDSAGNYVIENHHFELAENAVKEVELPPGMKQRIETGSPVPWFVVFKLNMLNCIDDNNGLGMSVFHNALDNLKGIDIAFNNLCGDFKLGAKKVFMNKTLLARDSSGAILAPDDVNQQLFTYVGDEIMQGENGRQLLQEFNPLLRVQENVDGVQAQLDYLSFKVGFGTKHYQFNAGSIVTATQYAGDKQELLQNANKQYIAVEAMLVQLVRSLLFIAKEVLGAPVDPDTKVSIQFDDSIIGVREDKLASMREDAAAGLLRGEIYLAEKYGVSVEEARKMMPDMAALIDDPGGGE